MIGDFNREDWQGMLSLTPEEVPPVLVLRGTRQGVKESALRKRAVTFRPLAVPNGVIDGLYLCEGSAGRYAYAHVYGAPMAGELVHVFGVLGTGTVIQTGSCGALTPELRPGDIFIATRAGCGEGVSAYYCDGDADGFRDVECRGLATGLIEAATDLDVRCGSGAIFTTSALMAETTSRVQSWREAGYLAVDMETAATFAVAAFFGMKATSVLTVFDNPILGEHLLEGFDKRVGALKKGARACQTLVDLAVRHGNATAPTLPGKA